MYPYFIYCVLIWGNTFSTYLDSLVKLQKRAIRTICGENKLAHTEPLFKKMNLFNFSELCIYSIGIFMFKFHSSLLPSIFSNFFTYNRNVHGHFTRQCDLLHVPKSSSQLRAKGVSISNNLEKYIKRDCTLWTYKMRLKCFIKANGIGSLL